MSAKRALLTGGTGFVGANLARRLLADGHDVTLAVRAGHAGWRLEGIEADLRLAPVDLGDPAAVRALVEETKPDWIFHLAAHGAYPTQTDVSTIVRTNYVSTVNLVEAALAIGFEAFVNTGSSSEYGFQDHAPAETELPEPNSHYAATKSAATQYCRFVGNAKGINIPTLRLYSVYGPWEEPSRLMPALVLNGLEGGYPPLANPAIARDYVEVADVCEAFIRAAARPIGGDGGHEPGAVYNVGSGVQTTLAQAVDAARAAFAIAAVPQWGGMAARGWDTNVWVSDSRRMDRELDWRATTPLAVGLRRFADWFGEDAARADWYRERIRSGAKPR